MRRVLVVSMLAGFILAGCKIDETYPTPLPQGITYYIVSVTPGPTPIPLPHPTTDPRLYPTVGAHQIHMQGEFIPTELVHVFKDISLTKEVGTLEPGIPVPFVAYTNIDGAVTFLCVQWNASEDGVSFRWDCTGWVLSSADGYQYGTTVYYYGIDPVLAPTRMPTQTVTATPGLD